MFTNKLYLEPAMKPRMSAFSGLVTLLAVRNISCASNICSLVRDRFRRCPGCVATGAWIVCTTGCKQRGLEILSGRFDFGDYFLDNITFTYY